MGSRRICHPREDLTTAACGELAILIFTRSATFRRFASRVSVRFRMISTGLA
jgi:hypothetical protein